MTGVWEGLRVLDLSSGIAGPIAGMLLADHGADVVKIEPPHGDRFRALSGDRVWQRGKRNAVLDPRDPVDQQCLLALVQSADVVLESFRPGRLDEIGLGWDVLRDANPQLVMCSISGYGQDGPDAQRPAIDALVAACSGQIWEVRGRPGTTPLYLAGLDDPLEGVDLPADAGVGPPRDGPLFPGVPWVSLGTAYLATLGISAALRAREVTGQGEWVQTSLLQGALATSVFGWQRTASAGESGFSSWSMDPRAPKGVFRCADGRWVHQWTPQPVFLLEASKGERLARNENVKATRVAVGRLSLDIEETIVLGTLYDEMVASVAKFTAEEWEEFASEVGVPLHQVRSPEEALADPSLLADGCVVELPDPALGPVRQVGQVYRLSACPTSIRGGVATRGADTDEIRAEASSRLPLGPRAKGRTIAAPLAGTKVVEVGLAIAAPFGGQLLAELGADVIKIQQLHDVYWMGTHYGMACNRGKRSLAIDLASAEGSDAFQRLAADADVVLTNMRPTAAKKLGIDDEAVRAYNPTVIHCHTRGFERGLRDPRPANDQSAAAVVGTEWLDGACDAGGAPIWSLTSLGDTGVGFLAAIGVVQALYHRDRTGKGQSVDTSIVYAHLLNSSMAWATSDGRVTAERPRLDAQHTGWGPLYRLYRAADEWLCVAACTGAQRAALLAVLGKEDLLEDPRVATRDGRHTFGDDFAAELQAVIETDTAVNWFERLDAAGVPVEIAAEDAARRVFDAEHLWQRGWLHSYVHGSRGTVDTAGHLIDFADLRGVLERPSPLAGEHSVEVLREVGFDEVQIEDLIARGLVLDAGRVDPAHARRSR